MSGMRRLVLLVMLLLPVPAAAAQRPVFGWPVAGPPVVDRAFSPPQSEYGAGHRGVDLRSAVGAAVLAAGPGEVTYAGVLAGRGVVTVTHGGGLRTTYEPVTAVVRVGQAVARGALLGHLSAGHASCRAGTTCLHWGLLRGQTYLDPLALVQRPDVRLLPVEPGLQLAQAPSDSGWSGPARSAGALAATGALVTGIGLLVRRPAGPPSPPGPGATPVDLRLERQRRRAA